MPGHAGKDGIAERGGAAGAANDLASSVDVRSAIADIQALKTYDPLYSLELAEHIQSLFDEHMPFVPLCFDTTTVYLRGNFASGVECSTQDIFYNIERWQNPK